MFGVANVTLNLTHFLLDLPSNIPVATNCALTFRSGRVNGLRYIFNAFFIS